MKIEYLIDRQEHVETIAKWNYEEWGYLSKGSNVESFIKGVEWTLRRGEIPIAFIATDGSEVLASVNLVKLENEYRKDLSPWLSCLYVHTDFRCQGIGTELCNHIIMKAKELGYDSVYLEAFPELREYYSSLGWNFLEMSSFKGKEVVIMSRRTNKMV